MTKADFVLLADDPHSRCLQLRELILVRTLPKAHIQVESRRLVLRSHRRFLKPNCDGERAGIQRILNRGGKKGECGDHSPILDQFMAGGLKGFHRPVERVIEDEEIVGVVR